MHPLSPPPLGALLGTPSPTSTCSGAHYIHVEVVRRTGGADVPVNPTPFLQPLREPSVQIEFECNQLVVMEMGMVVATLDVSGENPERMLLGEPLIDDLRILPHEFPQSVDQIVSGSGAYSPPSVVEFFSDSTSLMVGPNMVSFGECGSGGWGEWGCLCVCSGVYFHVYAFMSAHNCRLLIFVVVLIITCTYILVQHLITWWIINHHHRYFSYV